MHTSRHGIVAALIALSCSLTACTTSSVSVTTTSQSTASGQSAPAASSTSSSAGTSAAPSAAATSTPSASAEALPKGDGTKTVYLVSMGFQHRFWQAVKEGAEQAGKEYGYQIKFVGPDDETKVTQQLDQLKTALDSRPAAIGFAALDSGAAASTLAAIKAANIPVVAFDSGVESDIPVTTVQTNNRTAAAAAAEHMAELVGKKGTVGLICHDSTSQSGKDRCAGFQDWMKQHAPDIKLLQPQIAGEVGLAANTAKAMIQANPTMVGLYGSNEAAGSGAVQGAIEAGKKDLKVVGFDSGKTQIAAVKSGEMAGAITQSPVKMGYETVVAAVKAINGRSMPKIIDSGFAWYDKSNIDSAEIKQNLYE